MPQKIFRKSMLEDSGDFEGHDDGDGSKNDHLSATGIRDSPARILEFSASLGVFSEQKQISPARRRGPRKSLVAKPAVSCQCMSFMVFWNFSV